MVIAAPPVLASAETGPLADSRTMTLLVADARRSARAQVRTAVGELMRSEKIVGWVLADVGGAVTLPRPRGPSDVIDRPPLA